MKPFTKGFLWGVIAVAGGGYVYHHWVKPIPGGKGR